MNMQAMLKQAQKMQKDMMNVQEEVNSEIFTGESSFVKVELKAGNIIKIDIDSESLDKEDIEMLEDILLVAINDAKRKYDNKMEEKMGPYTKGMPGLF